MLRAPVVTQLQLSTRAQGSAKPSKKQVHMNLYCTAFILLCTFEVNAYGPQLQFSELIRPADVLCNAKTGEAAIQKLCINDWRKAEAIAQGKRRYLDSPDAASDYDNDG